MWVVTWFYAYFLTASSIGTFGNGSTSKTTAMSRQDRPSRAMPGKRKYPSRQLCCQNFCIPLFPPNVSNYSLFMSHHVDSTNFGAYPPQHVSTNPADPCQWLRWDNLEGASRIQECQSANRHRRKAEKLNHAKPFDLDKLGCISYM